MPFSPQLLTAAILMLFLIPTARTEPQKNPARKLPQTPPPSRAAEDREGIEALQKRDVAAGMAFEVDRMLELWTDDAVLLPPRHDPVIGKAALRSFLEEKRDQYANYDMLAYNEEWNEVMTTGNYAYQWGTVTIRMKPPLAGEVASTAHAMRILKREDDGTWRVARALWNDAPPAPQ